MNFGPGDEDEHDEDEDGDTVLEDIESDESFDDDEDEDEEDLDDDSEDDEPDEEGFVRTKRKKIDPDDDDVTHAIDCPLDDTCSCGDDE